MMLFFGKLFSKQNFFCESSLSTRDIVLGVYEVLMIVLSNPGYLVACVKHDAVNVQHI